MPGMALLAHVHSNFHPEVEAYLMKRHRNVAMTVKPPKCPVSIGLLIALHFTTQEKSGVFEAFFGCLASSQRKLLLMDQGKGVPGLQWGRIRVNEEPRRVLLLGI